MAETVADTMSAGDREILRRFAGRVAELAARPIEAEKRDLWYRHNALEPTRPVIFCDPEGGWREIIPADAFECEAELARHWELILRREVFWGESMGDDRVAEPHFDVYHQARDSGFGVDEIRVPSPDALGAYRIEAALASYADLGKLRQPQVTVDHDATERRLALAHEVFDGLLTVRLQGSWWWSLGMTHDAIRMRGIEQYMLDMYDDPQGLHRLMAFLRDCNLAKIDSLEQQNLLSLNNADAYVGSGGFGYTHELPQSDFDGTHVRAMDMWGFCESQETVSVSPALFEEFVFQYQLPIMARFGLNCYGCCEPLDKRWHVIRRSPRLRRVSVSAWASLADMAEHLGAGYIYSMKPNPADLAVPQLDEERIRAQLRRAFEVTRGCRVEAIMKDCHTIGGNPQNAVSWCRIAREEADRAGAP